MAGKNKATVKTPEQLAQERIKTLQEQGPKKVTAALRSLDRVGNLGKLKPNARQQQAVIEALQERLDEVTRRLAGGKAGATGFALPQ